MERDILNKYKNPEERLILSKVIDKIFFCENKNQMQITNFLDLRQQELVRKFLIHQKVENYIFFGGYDEAERKCVIFYPKKIKELILENKIDYNEEIKVIRITLPSNLKGEYTHKNYLGGLIKLGLNREKIGDILVDENGADIIISKEILIFLLTNLESLTRFQKSNIEEIKLRDLKNIELQKEELKITVSSTRLDNIISELIKCSRSKSLEILNEQRVFVNYELIEKPTKEIKENDKITIRGKGRFFIKEILGNTRKGKIIINVEK